MDGYVYLDACHTGIGAIFQNEVYHASIPTDLKYENINILEMFNILVLKLFRVWAK